MISTTASALVLAVVPQLLYRQGYGGGLKIATGNDFAKDNGMHSPGGFGYIRWSVMDGRVGEHGEDDGFQSGIWIAVMFRSDDRYGLHSLSEELHEQRILGTAAADNDFINGLMWKNKSLVIEGNGLDRESGTGANDIRWADMESGRTVVNALPQFFTEGFASSCFGGRLSDKWMLQQLG